MDNNFEQLKEMCRVACHERNACKQGYEALMKTENIAQIMQGASADWSSSATPRSLSPLAALHGLTSLRLPR